MKWVYRFVFPLLLLLSVETKSQTYTYHPFPDSNFTWKGSVHCSQGMGGSFNQAWTFNLTGDTIINGLSYHKLAYGIYGNIYCLREDSNKRVYALSPYDSVYHFDTILHETLMYDFSVSVGDTTTCAGGIYVVSAIDTLNYNGVLRRRFIMAYPANNQFSDTWIEGIGSTAGGPVGYMWHWFFCSYTTSSSLCLAKKDSLVLYGDYCPSWMGFEIIQEQSISIYPNPSTTSFTLQLSSSPTTQTYFQLYDALGRQVKREEIVSETTTTYRNNLPSGIYFWQLQSGNKIQERGKVVFE